LPFPLQFFVALEFNFLIHCRKMGAAAHSPVQKKGSWVKLASIQIYDLPSITSM
jgi:hypothetical protein